MVNRGKTRKQKKKQSTNTKNVWKEKQKLELRTDRDEILTSTMVQYEILVGKRHNNYQIFKMNVLVVMSCVE